MLELYVLVSLGALGYMINRATESSRPIASAAHPSVKTIAHETPSMSSVYASTHTQTTDARARRLAAGKHASAEATARDAAQGIRTENGGVVSNAYALTPKPVDHVRGDAHASTFVSSLTGRAMRADEFAHGNQVPYFGSRIRQNTADDAHATRLETFTGVSSLHCQKRETAAFGDVSKGMVNGTPSGYDQFYRERIVAPTVQNNVGPVPQQRVGPGLGLGFGTQPSGGFQQFESTLYAREKSVDELRTRRNPDANALGVADRGRATYEGRTLPGMRTGLRGDAGRMAPPKVDNTTETGDPDHWLRTTGAVVAPTSKTGYAPRETQRRTTTCGSEAIGPAFAQDAQARTLDPEVRPAHARGAPCKDGPEPGVAAMARFGKGPAYDHGKGNIELFANQRDVTGARHQTSRNVASLVKAIVAPVQDAMRLTRKNWSDPHPRSFGFLGPQFPDKQTVYDPTDVARTTIKETLIHDDHSAGGVTGPVRAYVYDPEEVARATVRETLEAVDPNRNVGGPSKVTRRPDVGTPNTTVKETTVDKGRLYGNVDAREGGGGYEVADPDAKTTMRQLWTEHDDHYGGALRDEGTGYLTNPKEAKRTQKQDITAHSEHYGGSGAADGARKAASEDYVRRNAVVSAAKEATLSGRDPTDTREKLFNADVPMAVPRKATTCSLATRDAVGFDRVSSAIPTVVDGTCGVTRPRRADVDDRIERLDPTVLDALQSNPFALRRLSQAATECAA